MSTLTPAAVKMLRRVQRLILAEPKRIAMRLWYTHEKYHPLDLVRGYPKCGTVGCIGGWVDVLALGGPKKAAVARVRVSIINSTARSTLGITLEQASELFYDGDLTGARNQQTLAHAQAVARHIDRFIEKYT